VAANIGSYTPASVANTLMAFAALGFSTPPLTEAAAAAVLSGLQQQQQRYRPHHVAHSVYALSRLQSCSPQLLEATAAVFTQEPQAYAPSHLSMLVWVGVLNRQQGLPAGFMRQVMQSSTQKMQDFSGDQVGLFPGLVVGYVLLWEVQVVGVSAARCN
jgi:fructose-specific phosphotransferase system IIC component